MPVHIADSPLDSVVLGAGSASRTLTPSARCSFPTDDSLPNASAGGVARDGSCALLDARRTRRSSDRAARGRGRADHHRFPRRRHSAPSLGGRVFGPVEQLAGDVTGAFRGRRYSSEVASLQQQNDQLRARARPGAGQRRRRRQLASLLHLSAGKYKVVTGTVIAAGGDYSDTVTINVGSSDGITANETVLNGDGLVGTVVSATPTTATVQLADRRRHHGRRPDGGRRPDRRAVRQRRRPCPAAPRSS